jgi:hypothetical protein
VVLDYELKQELYKKLSRVPPDKDLAYERIRLASEYDLKVVNDKIPIPDLRIEYEDECWDIHRLDLEILTTTGMRSKSVGLRMGGDSEAWFCCFGTVA